VSKPKRIIFGFLGALVLLAVLAAVGRAVFRPAMPSAWRNLHAGMTHEQVIGTAVGQYTDMRELKGMDVFTQETTMLGASSYWQLHVIYDQSGRLVHADARFIHRSLGLLSRVSLQSIL
jgi:hypothetical protein